MNRILLAASSILLLFACAQAPGSKPSFAGGNAPVFTPLEQDCDPTLPLVPGIPGSPGHLIRSPRNPNGDSELSYLMRLMADDLEACKKALANGEKPKAMLGIHRRIRCSWPTKLDERSPQFDAMAQAYLGAVKAFDEAPSQVHYNAIVQGCVACHSISCRGPLDRIDGLVWR